VEGLANGLYTALRMPLEEQETRMRRMRAHVADNNIYRWAGQLLSAVGKLVADPMRRAVGVGDSQDEELCVVPHRDFFSALRLPNG
jgi:trehalose-6-phosphate synthase